MSPAARRDGARSLGREAVGGLAMPDRGFGATSPDIAVSLPPLTRDSAPDREPCVMCDHARARHTAGTDGAGWCAGEARCECGGFQSGGIALGR